MVRLHPYMRRGALLLQSVVHSAAMGGGASEGQARAAVTCILTVSGSMWGCQPVGASSTGVYGSRPLLGSGPFADWLAVQQKYGCVHDVRGTGVQVVLLLPC